MSVKWQLVVGDLALCLCELRRIRSKLLTWFLTYFSNFFKEVGVRGITSSLIRPQAQIIYVFRIADQFKCIITYCCKKGGVD